MIPFLKDFFGGFKNRPLFIKILTIFLMALYVTALCLIFIKVDYIVATPGTINNTVQTKDENKAYTALTVETEYDSGDIFTIGIYNHYRVSLFQYLIAKLSNDVQIDPYDPLTDLSEEDDYRRSVIMKEISITNALIVAYEAAQLKDPAILFSKEFEGMKVSWVSEQSNTNLKVGDIITQINGTMITDLDHFLSLRDGILEDAVFSLTVLREEAEIVLSARKIASTDDQGAIVYRLGIEALPYYKVTEAFPHYELSNDLNSVGGSGGAMLALGIYNCLLPDDISGGKIVAGTGTIAADGTVGDIGGVSQKISTAALYNVDYFFVNPEDYDEALAKYQAISPDFELVKVTAFSEIIAYLEGELNE
ncbi:MAG TPA: hypothetical protein DD618_03005 [Acholeplasmatales bacterium]|nr:hypothetical protein [Acholeplasmatales bacterium]